MAKAIKVERTNYYRRMNRQFLFLLWAHLPISLFTAYMAEQSFGFAIYGSLVILSLPTFLVLRKPEELGASIANSIALVCFSALMIHLSGGMTEMHFHIFTALGLIITLAQPLAVIAALLVVVVHHVGFFILLPRSLINYDASFGILVIHAVFALSIGVPAIFISRKFKTYIVGAAEIVGEIGQIVDGLSVASHSMSENSRALLESTNKEVSETTRTTSAIGELNEMIAKNTVNAAIVSRSSQISKQKSSDGVKVVSSVVRSLNEIKDNSTNVLLAVNKSNTGMEQILTLIREIGSKTTVINDIVFQTKLLSFNASVEAARAGEQGKGFAVVAIEVGNLARMSGNAAKEISDLLSTSVSRVQSIIEETKSEVRTIVDTGQVKIDAGLRVADQCKGLLEEIDRTLHEVATLSVEIESASREQASSVLEVTHAMSGIEKVSQQNSIISDAATEAARGLTDQTRDLNQAVERLVGTIEQGELDEAPAPAQRAKEAPLALARRRAA